MRARGLTLIEVTIAIAIAAVLFAAVAVSVGAVTGSRARASAGELAAVIRALYDTASLSGKTCRLAFELPDYRKDEEGVVRYRAECAESGVTTSRDREAQLREDSEAAKEEQERRERSGGRSGEEPPSLDDLLSQEQDRVERAARFSQYTAEELRPRELPSGVSLAVWTRHQRERTEQGLAYLYFFPQGYTERALLWVRQGDNVWTLSISPLTGKVTVVSEELEVPR